MASYQAHNSGRRRDPLLDSNTALVLEKRGRELVGVVMVIVGFAVALMIASYSPDDPSWLSATDAPVQNWLGRLGAYIAAPLFMILGLGTWALSFAFAVWGVRMVAHKAEGRSFLCVILAPVWMMLCSVYASGLPQGGDWTHHFGHGGLFGDMVMGSILTGLPLSPALGLKLTMLVLGLGIIGLGAFVLGFTREELVRIGRFMMIGVVMTYAFLVRLTGRGAQQAVGAARVMQERNAERRASRAAAAEAEAISHEGIPTAPRVKRAVPPVNTLEVTEDDVDFDDPAFAPPPEKTGFLKRMPSLIRRDPAPMPQPELVENLMDHDVDAPGEDRIRAKIASAVNARRPVLPTLSAKRPDPTKPLTKGRGHGPQPLLISQRTQAAGLPPEPPMTAGQAALPPEPPLTASRTVSAGAMAGAAGLPPLHATPRGSVPQAPGASRPMSAHVAEDATLPPQPAMAATPRVAEPHRTPPADAYTELSDFDDYGDRYDDGYDDGYDDDDVVSRFDEDDDDHRTLPPAPPMPAPPVHRAAPMQDAKKVVQQPVRKPVQLSTRAKLEAQPSLKFEDNAPEFELPPLSLLMSPERIERHHLSDEALEENARMLESVLDDYGVKGEIVSVRPGPVVTMYELEPAPGLKASRVIGLADDIARSMSALSARVSTVPGRSVIGIELPNDKREMVCFREILAGREYGDGNHKLPLALGKDIGGDPMVANLAKMPHLLIAGTTGSGKSVAINTMILSLLYKLTPEDLRLVMIDPKMLELSVYDGIPHLLSPVVTDPKKAVVALKWVVGEMEDRYRKMSKMGVRNIDGYNSRVADALSKGEMFSRTVQTGFDDETGEPVFETDEFEPKKMPYIVVIVDEMADLMMVAGKEIEACIQRLAQMARASGIHLIMATQRPSVDVITGTIKANFPTRISFQVTSKIDSRTILGEMGAEQLLGMGDMLYMAGGAKITRCHGPFVSDEEVEEIVNHLKAYGPPEYVGGVVEGPDEEKADNIDAVLGLNTGGNTGGEDALYDQAVAIVIKDRKCSTSYIQRKLGIGYNKAARLVEQMEDEGVVSAANHVGKREILVPEQA